MRGSRMLERGRRMAEELMTDTCEVGTEKLGTTLDPDTNERVVEFTAVYTGPCEFKAAANDVQEVDAAGQALGAQGTVLKLPVATSAAVKRNMVVKVTGSATDPGLVGVRARVQAPSSGSRTVSRRFRVEVIS